MRNDKSTHTHNSNNMERLVKLCQCQIKFEIVKCRNRLFAEAKNKQTNKYKKELRHRNKNSYKEIPKILLYLPIYSIYG